MSRFCRCKKTIHQNEHSHPFDLPSLHPLRLHLHVLGIPSVPSHFCFQIYPPLNRTQIDPPPNPRSSQHVIKPPPIGPSTSARLTRDSRHHFLQLLPLSLFSYLETEAGPPRVIEKMAEIGMNPPVMRTPLQDVRNTHNILRPQSGTPQPGHIQKPTQRVAPTIIIDEKEIQRSRLALQQRPHTNLNLFNPKSQQQQQLNPKVRMPLQPTYPEAKKQDGNHRTVAGGREKNNLPAAAGAAAPAPPATKPSAADVTRQWLQMLPKCRFYFDNVDPNIVSKMSKVLNAHSSVIARILNNCLFPCRIRD
jgi:hypothetical protein